MKYFYSSFVVSLIALAIAFYIGGAGAAYICALLCALEISLSFDNAVVNAKVLKDMAPVWQSRFILWGIPIAVFGMRFLFPVLIVAASAHLGIWETLVLALKQPHRYHEILSENEAQIYVFGGAFLLMVFCDFFFDAQRELHWLGIIENNGLVRFLKRIPNAPTLIALAAGLVLLAKIGSATLGAAYFGAILLYLLISCFGGLFGTDGVKNGLAGFLYLETLDASFSFDGVIGAFALSDNIFIIMLGLGAGAMFVRSITLYLIARGTLSHFAYLEHGAHYAIACLAFIMFAKLKFEVSEIITGTVGILFIALSLLSSVLYNRRNKRKLIETIAGNNE